MDAPIARKILGGMGGPEGKTGQKLALTTSSAQSTAIGAQPDERGSNNKEKGWIDIVTDSDCFIAIGANPTAVVDTSYKLLANAAYRFPITLGNKVAGIMASGTGNIWIHPV